MCKRGHQIKSIPINYRARIGEAKLGSVVDGWIIFKNCCLDEYFLIQWNQLQVKETSTWIKQGIKFDDFDLVS